MLARTEIPGGTWGAGVRVVGWGGGGWMEVIQYIIYAVITRMILDEDGFIVQELRESRGGHPGLSVLTSLLVFVDVKLY